MSACRPRDSKRLSSWGHQQRQPVLYERWVNLVGRRSRNWSPWFRLHTRCGPIYPSQWQPNTSAPKSPSTRDSIYKRCRSRREVWLSIHPARGRYNQLRLCLRHSARRAFYSIARLPNIRGHRQRSCMQLLQNSTQGRAILRWRIHPRATWCCHPP